MIQTWTWTGGSLVCSNLAEVRALVQNNSHDFSVDMSVGNTSSTVDTLVAFQIDVDDDGDDAYLPSQLSPRSPVQVEESEADESQKAAKG